MQPAPDFTLPDQKGTLHSLRDYRGKWVVVYFYPKDDTPGCTTEACSFRDGRDFLQAYGVEVIGISGDTVRSHKKFADKHGLDFTLLSDRDHKVTKAYGSWTPKKLFGHEFYGIHRDTYLIDKAGTIVKKYAGVDPKTHISDIIRDLKAQNDRFN